MLIKMESTYGKFSVLSCDCFQTGILIGSDKLEGDTNLTNVIGTGSLLSESHYHFLDLFL